VQLRVGTFFFPANAAEVTTRTAVVRASTGRPVRYKVSFHVKAYIEGSGQADLSLKENLLRQALLIPYQDIALLQDSGAASSSSVASASTITGVVVTDGPHFSEAQGAEYVNRRTCEFTAECEIPIVNADAAVVSFQESLTYFGTAGPVTRWRPAVNAGPVEQVVSPASTIRIVQAGQATGHRVWPTAPLPRWPFPVEQVEKRRITRDSPRRIGPGLGMVEWPISWQYEFEWDRPLVAFPNLPPL
jgi:hypothetical protein